MTSVSCSIVLRLEGYSDRYILCHFVTSVLVNMGNEAMPMDSKILKGAPEIWVLAEQAHKKYGTHSRTSNQTKQSRFGYSSKISQLSKTRQQARLSFHYPIAWVKAFSIIPEFRILRLTFHRKSASKC